MWPLRSGSTRVRAHRCVPAWTFHGCRRWLKMRGRRCCAMCGELRRLNHKEGHQTSDSKYHRNEPLGKALSNASNSWGILRADTSRETRDGIPDEDRWRHPLKRPQRASKIRLTPDDTHRMERLPYERFSSSKCFLRCVPWVANSAFTKSR